MEKEVTVKRTVKEIQEIDAVMGNLYSKDPTMQNTKLGYAYKKFIDKFYQPAITKFQEDLADARVDFALTDKTTGEVLVDKENPRGFKYDKENLKKVMAAESKLSKEWQEKEVIIIPFIVKDVPKVLTEEQRDLLKGILI